MHCLWKHIWMKVKNVREDKELGGIIDIMAQISLSKCCNRFIILAMNITVENRDSNWAILSTRQAANQWVHKKVK